MALGSPTPTVVHLLTVFRQISNGELRIPAFQRDFVWQQSQVLDLLESVRLGYPIGSILVWYVDKPLLKVTTNRHAFPDVPEKYPTNYILDGMQRLSSLYGVFHYGEYNNEPRFNVSFDLDREEFFVPDEPFSEERKMVLPLAALFSPRKLLDFQAKVARASDSDIVLDRVAALQSAFQDYIIPIVSIRGDDVRPIVSVFERVNSTGTTLSRTDFMRAITWDQDFDLTSQLEAAASLLSDLGFTLNEETIVKCISIQMGLDASSDALLALRHRSSSELQSAFEDFRALSLATISFCREALSIYSSKLIPYEGQWLVMFKAVGVDKSSNLQERDLLRRWFWAVSFNESLRGKPDHYVGRAVSDWQAVVAGRVRGLEPRLRLAPVDFMERRLIRGKALSTAFMGLFIHSGAAPIGVVPSSAMESLGLDADPTSFQNVLDRQELQGIEGFYPSPGKIFANLVMADPLLNSSIASDMRSKVDDLVRDGRYGELERQFFNEESYDALRRNNFKRFLEVRASLMHRGALELTNGTLKHGKMPLHYVP